MRRGILALLGASTMMAMSGAASAQDSGPAFRVPIGSGSANSSSPPIYAWLESISECSSTCGSGTRTTGYQCQNAVDFDYSGGGYGAPEADALCTSSVGPKPTSTSSSCTNYSGCGYDWVKPPVQQTPVPIDANPVGRIGCGQIRSVFSPYCQRTGGSSAVVLPSSDHRFCRNDTPDYNQVAAGDPDALGYDRSGPQTGSCNTSDHEWRGGDGEWGTWSSTCSSTATRTRPITCYRKFDNTAAADSKCDAGSRPASSQTQAVYDSCTYDWTGNTEADWGSWSDTCSNNATRTRSVSCKRSNGDTVADSSCVDSGKPKPTTSETQGVYSSCTYSAGGSTTNGSWSSQCSANATRSVTRQCVRSNGDVVPDAECSSRSIALTSTQTQAVYDQCSYRFDEGGWSDWSSHCSASASRTRSVTCRRSDGTAMADAECTNRGIARSNSSETTAVYDQCGYTPRDMGRSACTMQGQQNQYWDCTRADGTTGFAASLCGKSNPEVVACTPPYTYSPHDHGIGACENNQRPHYWDCMRNDGQDGFPASYCGKTNPEMESCVSVSYSWNVGGWSDWNSHCSGNATRTRSVSCRGTDGSTGQDAQCGGARPTSSETTGVYDQCGYTPEYGGWNACTNGTQTRGLTGCRRSDGVAVATSNCTDRGAQGTQTQSCQTSGNICSGGTGLGEITRDITIASCNQQGGNCVQSKHYHERYQNQNDMEIEYDTWECFRGARLQWTGEACSQPPSGGGGSAYSTICITGAIYQEPAQPKNGEGQCVGGTQVGQWGSYSGSMSGSYQTSSRNYPRGYNNIQFPNWCLQTMGGTCWDEHETYYVADERAGGVQKHDYEMRCFTGTSQIRSGISYDASTSDGLTVDWSRWNWWLK